MRNKTAKILFIVFIFLFFQSFYTVGQGELAVISRFGEIKKVIVKPEYKDLTVESIKSYESLKNVVVESKRGYFFKVPFIDKVEQVSGKALTYTSLQETISTLDKRKLDIQMFAQYRVANPAIYKMKIGSEAKLDQLLDDQVYPVVIQSANRLTFNQFFDQEIINKMLEDRTTELNKTLLSQYGIQIIDIGMHRKKFPTSTEESIAEKMTKEIQKESERLIAEGDAHYTKVTSETRRKESEILAKAKEESANIKANAEKEALIIYEQSLKKDVEFYRFIQRMDSYKTMTDKTIFIDKENEFFKYINGYN